MNLEGMSVAELERELEYTEKKTELTKLKLKRYAARCEQIQNIIARKSHGFKQHSSLPHHDDFNSPRASLPEDAGHYHDPYDSERTQHEDRCSTEDNVTGHFIRTFPYNPEREYTVTAYDPDQTIAIMNENTMRPSIPETFAAPIIQPKATPKLDVSNYRFYKGIGRTKPEGLKVDTILNDWYYDYDELEKNHSYIQWLFPMFKESGVNHKAKALTREEASLIRTDLDCSLRVLDAFKMMLNFWGFRLVDALTGEIQRHEDDMFALSRLLNIVVNNHNCLRISRVLVSLGQLGFSRYKQPFLEALRREVSPTDKKTGPLTKVARSFTEWWAPTCTEDDSSDYRKRTLENGPEDRIPSVLFEHIESNSSEWQDYVRGRERVEEEVAEARQQANDREIQRAREILDNRKQSNQPPISL
eukprot:TRINITY_DN11696_c0_g1_i1.p1 TRINITY_DN11696_c0_g1~~TRINITY_DN11696_c0_g1_i1.p1  ORF type:complete len:416 (-),score=59.12 TRINITY_DN11696_c0_g1_i1:11-1258(-)